MSRRNRMSPRVARAATVLAVVVAAAGCRSSTTRSSSTAATTSTAAEAGSVAASSSTTSSATTTTSVNAPVKTLPGGHVDACSLLSPSEAGAAIGAPIQSALSQHNSEEDICDYVPRAITLVIVHFGDAAGAQHYLDELTQPGVSRGTIVTFTAGDDALLAANGQVVRARTGSTIVDLEAPLQTPTTGQAAEAPGLERAARTVIARLPR